jgi:hypothetical protein
VLTPDEDCASAGDGVKCEASKYREGFCLEFRDECPDCEPCEEEERDGSFGLAPSLFQLSNSAANAEEVAEQLKKIRPACMDSPPCPTCHCDDDGAVGLATLVIDCATNTVDITCECRHYVWSPRLIQWLVCRLFGNVDKLPKAQTGLDQAFPAAHAFVRNPLPELFELGAMAVQQSTRPSSEKSRVKTPPRKGT